MEELLNKLIKRGWKPFNVNCDWTNVEVINRLNDNRYIPEHSEIIFQTDTHRHVFDCNIRDLVSKSSGLWQFVCDREHRFIDERNYDGVSLDKRLKNPYVDYDGVNTEYEWITGLDYQYWVIEASLKDERELEQFLLDNIKIDEKKS